MRKATTDLTGYAGPDLITTSQTIHDAMIQAATTFPNPPTSMPDFKTAIDTCDTALTKKASRATADINAFNVARETLEGILSGLGNYVNTVAKGDDAIVIASGFPSYQTGNTPDYAAPAAPTNLVLRQGDVSGQLVLRSRPKRTPSMNEVQTTTGDPAVDSNWKTFGMFSGGKATLDGFTPGSTIWVRERTAGLRGVMGDWSDPVKAIVT